MNNVLTKNQILYLEIFELWNFRRDENTYAFFGDQVPSRVSNTECSALVVQLVTEEDQFYLPCNVRRSGELLLFRLEANTLPRI